MFDRDCCSDTSEECCCSDSDIETDNTVRSDKRRKTGTVRSDIEPSCWDSDIGKDNTD
jgi:hypothetical protein